MASILRSALVWHSNLPSHGHQVKNSLWPPESTSGSGKQVTIAAVNDDYSGTESDSGESGGGPTLDTAFNRVWRADFAAGDWK
jgi:hypothetical protein